MKRLLIALIVALPLAFAAGLMAQTAQEVSTSVPELEKFHDVIMPMWHTAYPAKDYAALRKIAPDVQAGVAKIAAVKLPGILHEKEAAWAKGIAELKAAAAAYAKAAAGTDDKALLLAAENLHTVYEAQGQIIRPVVPEMNEFHKTMYVVQHTYVPEKKWADVCKVSGDLPDQGRGGVEGHAAQAGRGQGRGVQEGIGGSSWPTRRRSWPRARPTSLPASRRPPTRCTRATRGWGRSSSRAAVSGQLAAGSGRRSAASHPLSAASCQLPATPGASEHDARTTPAPLGSRVRVPGLAAVRPGDGVADRPRSTPARSSP